MEARQHRRRRPGRAAARRLPAAARRRRRAARPRGRHPPGLAAVHRPSRHASRPTSSPAASPAATSTCATPASSSASTAPTGSTERAWPLAHVPVLIEEAEWARIAARPDPARRPARGGARRPLRRRTAWSPRATCRRALIAGSREWLRPLVGVAAARRALPALPRLRDRPRPRRHLVGARRPHPGALGRRLRAGEPRRDRARLLRPLRRGARPPARRLLPHLPRRAAGPVAPSPTSRVAILTPGPLNDTYFEHAYIARYLGFMLLEGEDLTVEHGRVMVRTVAGLRPVSVLWRRLDAAFADPLELDAALAPRHARPRRRGARRARVTLVNALGSGVLETRALLAFLPRIAQALLGEPLILPNIATWWCGQPAERGARARQHATRMMIGPALSTRLPFETDETTVLGGRFRDGARSASTPGSRPTAPALVGQEAVTLSTTPAYVDGRLVPRPMSLRVFLARTAARLAGDAGRLRPHRPHRPTPTAIAMQRGGIGRRRLGGQRRARSRPTPCCPAAGRALRPRPPRRAAEPRRRQPLLARPLRRARRGRDAAAARLPRAPRRDRRPRGAAARASRRAISTPSASIPARRCPAALRWHARRRRSSAPATCATASRPTAGGAERPRQDRAPDGRAPSTPGDDTARAMGVLLRKITGFSGLVHENMYRFTGWRFLVDRPLARARASPWRARSPGSPTPRRPTARSTSRSRSATA